jgi:hypothetical protein
MTLAHKTAALMIALGLLAPAAPVAAESANVTPAPAPRAPVTPIVTAALSPADPIVGATRVTIAGTASAGATVVGISIFPDGSRHDFTAKADNAGAYRFGPFVLWQLGTYHDLIRDSATGTTKTISYSGGGDFRIAVDQPSVTIVTGGQKRLQVTVTSVGGFGGDVTLQRPAPSAVPGAHVWWSGMRLRVPPGGSISAILNIRTLALYVRPGVYQVAVQGASGSVTHAAAPAIALTVHPPPPGTLTATLSPDQPVVGVTAVRIAGRATPGGQVIDDSTFPNGRTHAFGVDVGGTGSYSDGPFMLQQLGTYHDVVRDSATGAKTEISYQGVGDFSTSVDRTSVTVARGEEAKFEVTFKSLSGFAGDITPAVPELSQIAGATASWSSPALTVRGTPPWSTLWLAVRSGDSTAAALTIKTSSETRPGTYKINVQGTNGSVTHAAPSAIELIVKE